MYAMLSEEHHEVARGPLHSAFGGAGTESGF